MTILNSWQQLKNRIDQMDERIISLLDDIEFNIQIIANNTICAYTFPGEDLGLLTASLERIEDTFGIKGELDDIEDEDALVQICPRCGASCNEDQTINDHGMCHDCFVNRENDDE